jgi:pyruvate dehydrogenase E2 component (dihydrolipoamide acetyltransferase)
MPFEISIPRLGWSMEEGTFAGWRKEAGDTIRRGDILFELEGEKALQEIEAVDEGVLAITLSGPKPGDVLKVGAIVGYLLAPGETLANPLQPGSSQLKVPAADIPAPKAEPIRIADIASVDTQVVVPAAAPSIRRLARQLDVALASITGTGSNGRITDEDVQQAATRLRTSSPSEQSDGRIIATPRARRAAKQMGVDLTNVNGSGREGRIRERDVLAQASAPTSGRRIAVTGRRKVIAERLSQSARQTVPVTITSRVDASNLVSLREQFKATAQKPVPAIHDIIAKLLAEVLTQFPLLASRWEGADIVQPNPDQIHIGLAVDTPEGLIVPVIRNISGQSLMNLAVESARVIQKARDGKLSTSEMQGAVFTITNLGAFGIDAFTPVINLPETAILGLGAIRREPVVAEDGRIEVRQIMTLSLTFDHRVIDGAPAARFLQTLVNAIANPAARLIFLGS